MKPVTRMAWAIDTRSEAGHGLLGKGWFAWPADTETWQWGLMIALWATRKSAKAMLPKVRDIPYGFPKACVRRVKVTIRVS